MSKMTEVRFPPSVDVDEIRRHVRDTLPGLNNAPPEINRLANDVQPLLRAYDDLRAENERLRAALGEACDAVDSLSDIANLQLPKEFKAWRALGSPNCC